MPIALFLGLLLILVTPLIHYAYLERVKKMPENQRTENSSIFLLFYGLFGAVLVIALTR